MAKPKDDKTIFEIDGIKVEFTQIDRWYHSWGVDAKHPNCHPKERTRWEIRVDGAFVGYARRPYGWGKQALLVDGLWDAHRHGLGENELLKAHFSNENYELTDIAPMIIEWRTTNNPWKKLRTLEEIEAAIADHKQREEQRKIEAAAREAQWEQEKKDREAADKARKEETLEGLESIRTDLGTQLSNFQAEMLERVIELVKRRGV